MMRSCAATRWRENAAYTGEMPVKNAGLFSLDGQVALILGGSSGIGRAIALGLHDAGAIVVPVGKTQAKVNEVEAALTAQGTAARGFCADVTQPEALTEVVTQT